MLSHESSDDKNTAIIYFSKMTSFIEWQNTKNPSICQEVSPLDSNAV